MVVPADGLQALFHVPACCTPATSCHIDLCTCAHTLTVYICTRANAHPHGPFLLSSRLTVHVAPHPPGHTPLLTLLLHATLQALAQAAGLALPPGLLGDLTGALPEGAPQPDVALHGPPVREQRATGRPWGTGQGSAGHTSLPQPGNNSHALCGPLWALPLPLRWVRFMGKVHGVGDGVGNSSSYQMVWASLVASEWLEQRVGRKTFLQHSHCVCAFSRHYQPQPLLEGCSSRPQAQLLPHIPIPIPLHLCPCY